MTNHWGSIRRRAGAAAAVLALAASATLGSPAPAAAADPPAWERVVGGASGNPAAIASTTGGYVDAFVRTGSTLFHQRQLLDASVEEDLGGVLTSDPAATATADGTYVFVVGIDGGVWYRLIADDGTAGPWTGLGGISRRVPTVVTDRLGDVHVFVVGADQAVWTRHQEPGGTWSAWTSFGGVVTADIAVGVPYLAEQVYLSMAVRGSDGALYRGYLFGEDWTGFERVGGRIVGAPAAFGQEIAVRGVDDQVYFPVFYTQPPSFFATGGFITGDLVLANGPSQQYPKVVALGRGPDGAVWREAWGGQNRSGWSSLGGNITSRIAAAMNDPFEPCPVETCVPDLYYVVAPDGALYSLATE